MQENTSHTKATQAGRVGGAAAMESAKRRRKDGRVLPKGDEEKTRDKGKGRLGGGAAETHKEDDF